VAPTLRPTDLAKRLERDVEHNALRMRNGISYVAGTHRPQLGRSPKDVVWRRDKAELWHYRCGRIRYWPPLMLVHSLVSRSYIMDLLPGNSMVEFLCGAGFDVFLLDWGVADELDAENTFETYVEDYLPLAVEAACAESGSDELTLDGYCLGGVLALLYAAGCHDAPIRNLIVMATPVDWDQMGPLAAAFRKGRLGAGDVVDESGNVPPDVIYNGFRTISPTGQLVQYVNLWEHLWDDEYMQGYQAMGQWTRDHVPFPGAAFGQMVQLLIRENALMRGTMRLGGHEVDLGDVRPPLLNVMAERDTIVPLRAAGPLTAMVGGESEELRLPAGHVALAAGRLATKLTLPRLAEWVAAHSVARGGTR
jgi:poly[(R)-3-hydroxyalkanoate] polymerase subunit PhaC